MAGLSSLIVLAFAGSLLGLGVIFIFPFIHWSYRLVNLTNLIIVISCMESLGFPVGNSFNCSSPLYPLSPTIFLHIGRHCVCFFVLLDAAYSTYVCTIAACTFWPSPQSHLDFTMHRGNTECEQHLITSTCRPRQPCSNISQTSKERKEHNSVHHHHVHENQPIVVNQYQEIDKRKKEKKTRKKVYLFLELDALNTISANVVGPLPAGRCGGGACDAPCPCPPMSGGSEGEGILPVRLPGGHPAGRA